MDKPSVKDLSNQLLETVYHDKVAYRDIEMPEIVKGMYKAILEQLSLADIEAELVARGYELPMSN